MPRLPPTQSLHPESIPDKAPFPPEKLFQSLENALSADEPADCALWVGEQQIHPAQMHKYEHQNTTNPISGLAMTAKVF